MDPVVVRVLAVSSAGWVSSALCATAAAIHVRRLSRHAPPVLEAVHVSLAALQSDAERASVRAELHERRADAERALSFATLLPRSLARIALASGTALALTSLARAMPSAAPELIAGAAFCFVGGFAGMLMCAAFGRQARSRANEMRQHWKRVVRAADGQWTPANGSG